MVSQKPTPCTDCMGYARSGQLEINIGRRFRLFDLNMSPLEIQTCTPLLKTEQSLSSPRRFMVNGQTSMNFAVPRIHRIKKIE